ncbi:MAG: glycosyltransferase [Opitutales bacterium]|nr:glycosyltransferase [Opitutales bacterium]
MVSVIIIFKNEERFLGEAIESVLAQTYTDWELILVDDASTDKGTDIAKGYQEQLPGKVRYLTHPNFENRGMSASRNLAIGSAKGELISFIDGDDYWFPDKLKSQVSNLQEHPGIAMVCSPAQLWYSWTNKLEDQQKDFVQEYPIETNKVVKAPQMFQLFLANEFFSICDVLVRKEIVDAVGGYDDAFRDMYEDQVFHSKICLRYPIFISTEAWYRYRRHPGSCTHQSLRSEDHAIKRTRFLEWLQGYLKETGSDTPELKANLSNALWGYRHPVLAKLISQPNKKGLKDLVNRVTQTLLPAKAYTWFYNQCRFKHWPPVGWVRFGSFRRSAPISRSKWHRGTSIDAYYIERFLDEKKSHIHGEVLENSQSTYTWKYGEGRVTKSDVVDFLPGNPAATIVGDLSNTDLIPANSFDCVILNQTLLTKSDHDAAIKSIYRILKPGGTALVTLTGISPEQSSDQGSSNDLCSYTSSSSIELFKRHFPESSLTLQTFGNVLAATSFLHGISAEELKTSELDHLDSQYPIILALTATKPNA